MKPNSIFFSFFRVQYICNRQTPSETPPEVIYNQILFGFFKGGNLQSFNYKHHKTFPFFLLCFIYFFPIFFFVFLLFVKYLFSISFFFQSFFLLFLIWYLYRSLYICKSKPNDKGKNALKKYYDYIKKNNRRFVQRQT